MQNWSNDDNFCLTNGWEKNRNEEELFKWWLHHVNNVTEDFIRLGIEYNEKFIGYTDLASIKVSTAELGIAMVKVRCVERTWLHGSSSYD